MNVRCFTQTLLLLLILACLGCSQSTASQSFYDSLMSDDAAQMRRALADGADVNSTRLDGWRPLPFSAARKRKVAVQWLLENGADVESVDGGGNTALLWAVRTKDREMISILLRAGADPCSAGIGGTSALQMAEEFADVEMLASLGPCKAGGKM